MISKHHPTQSLSSDKAGAPVQFGALLMGEDGTQRSGPPYLFQGLSESEIARVVVSGKRKVLYRGAQLFSQGSPQDGIYLIETGRIKVFYTAPSGARSRLLTGTPAISSAARKCSSRASTSGRGRLPSTAPCCTSRAMFCAGW